MQLTFFSLGSGSCGNCYYLATDTDAIIIDCGISIRRFKKNMLEYGMKIGKVKGMLITHDQGNWQTQQGIWHPSLYHIPHP
ncbi:MAG: hypothetical protein ACOCOC_07435 [Prevotella sp.]